MHAFRHNGEGSLRPRKRGRRPGEQLAIAPDEQLKIVDIIAQHTPDQVGLPYLLWTRAAVGKLIDQELSITLGPATVRNYLIRWGLPMPKPIRASETPHTAIPGGETVSVQWRTTRWSVEGHEPVQEATAFIAVSNRGATYFALHRQPPDSAQLGDRLTRLTDHIGRPTTIITLAWPPNHHDTLQTWIANNLRQVVVVRLAPS
jgi:transposase